MMSRFFRLGVTLVILVGVLAGCTDEAIGHYRLRGQQHVSRHFSDGEYLFIDKVAYLEESPQRGDIIVFNRIGADDNISSA